MTKISKIYESDHFLFEVGSRNGKTRNQINEMIDRQRPKSCRKVKKTTSIIRTTKSKVDLNKDSVSQTRARRTLRVSRKELDKLLSDGQLQLVAGKSLGLKITIESIKKLLSSRMEITEVQQSSQQSPTSIDDSKLTINMVNDHKKGTYGNIKTK